MRLGDVLCKVMPRLVDIYEIDFLARPFDRSATACATSCDMLDIGLLFRNTHASSLYWCGSPPSHSRVSGRYIGVDGLVQGIGKTGHIMHITGQVSARAAIPRGVRRRGCRPSLYPSEAAEASIKIFFIVKCGRLVFPKFRFELVEGQQLWILDAGKLDGDRLPLDWMNCALTVDSAFHSIHAGNLSGNLHHIIIHRVGIHSCLRQDWRSGNRRPCFRA